MWQFSVHVYKKYTRTYNVWNNFKQGSNLKNGVFWNVTLCGRENLKSYKEVICKIRGFHGGDSEECSFLGCYAVRLL
jgi:hypothetical protein